jgi:hypothetical protein
MTRYALICLTGSLLLLSCDQSTPNAGPNSNARSSNANPARTAPPSNFVETAKAEALKVFCTSWTNHDGVWTSYLPHKKWRVQWTNLEIRVETTALTDKQVQAGIRAAAEVFFDAEMGRNEPSKGKWTEWRAAAPLRYAVVESNGVWHVQNNYRTAFALPPAQE